MIRVKELRVRLGGRDVLAGVSLDVAPGESVALVGPNGSGKTTLLRCLLGLVPFGGRATLGGHDVWRDGVAARSLVGYVPQRPAFGQATAEEHLAFVAKLRALDAARIADVLAEVGLASEGNRRARDFSGGMQQRLSLAAALLGDPPVLLFDEPTASLDQAGQRGFLELASRLRSGARTLLVASHRPEEVAALADRVVTLEDGRVVSDESIRDRIAVLHAGVAR